MGLLVELKWFYIGVHFPLGRDKSFKFVARKYLSDVLGN